MSEFYLPYHFVPAVKESTRTDPKAQTFRKASRQIAEMGCARHDQYLRDTYSGSIHCTAETVTTIFVGDEKNASSVNGFQLEGQPALPGSSLRGMVSSIAEAASNSALRVLSRIVLGQECYSYRKPMAKAVSAVGRLWKNGDGWELEPVCLPTLKYDGADLRREDRRWKTVFQKGPTFRCYWGSADSIRGIDPANPANRIEWKGRTKGVYVRVHALTWTDVVNKTQAAQANLLTRDGFILAQRRLEIPVNLTTEQKPQGMSRVLGCYERNSCDELIRQIPRNKKHELLLPYKQGRYPRLKILPGVIGQFNQLSHQMAMDSLNDDCARPYEPKDTRPNRKPGEPLEPKEGDLVFFDVDDTGTTVTEISFSSIWRGRVNDAQGNAAGPWTFFQIAVDKETVPFSPGRNRITIAERVFGIVEEKDGKELTGGLRLKSRVRFSHGLAEGTVSQGATIPLKELSSPKPPSPALYFRPRVGQSNQFIRKFLLNPTDHKPQGRKFYLHNRDAINGNVQPWKHGGKALAEQRQVEIAPWTKGLWKFEIRFDNLDDKELGMLLYALQPTAEFRHKIGMGKPIGLGSIRISIKSVDLVERQDRYSASGWNAPRFSIKPFAWGTLRDAFRNSMNEEIRTAIETLGDPNRLEPATKVKYPRVYGQESTEDKLFKWFVANDKDKATGQSLQPIARQVDKKWVGKIEPLSVLPDPGEQ
jgi:CRISPR-associated protein (TIGR03986 family)